MDSPVAQDPVMDDTVLGGRYRLRSLLGSGGMAQVYDGWDERLARPVAVKLLRPDLAAVADLRRRFELEARAAARLTHPNVVAVYDAGDDHGRSYIVMERLGGESLADSIGHGPLDLAWLRRLAGEVLAALGAAHEAGIIHRDIKPGNILLGPDGQAKVSDFGIARVAEGQAARAGGSPDPALALTGAGLVLGTPAYLAPERAMGQPATRQSDLYALGVVLYEALTGRKPFAGATPVAIAAAAVRGAAEDPSVLRPDADPQLVAVIGRAMALDPAQRYATAAQMAADLRRPAPTPTDLMAAAPGSARAGAGAAGLAPRPPGGRPRWLPAALGAAAVGAIVLALVLANPGGSSRASTTATTLSPTTTATTAPRPSATTAPSTSATTAPAAVSALATDPTGVALQAYGNRLARSKSSAAAQLANGLSTVAALTDPTTRAQAASSLLDQTVQWYQQRQLTTSEYVVASALLQQAGAPQAPPPTRNGSAGGGGGGGD